LNNLGFVYQLAGNYDQAETCLKRAIDLHRSSPAPNELRVATSIGNLAKLYIENGQFAKAERLGLLSIADRVERIEPFSAELARILGSLGVVERHRRNHQPAEQHHRRALAIWEKRTPAGSEIVETLNNLGLVYLDSGREREALECFQFALKHAETGRSAAPTVAATLLANAGGLQFRLNGPGPAEPYFQRAAAVAEKSIGQSHRLTGRILANYAVVLRQLERKTEARDMEKRAKAIFASGASGVSDRYSVDVSTLRVR
jgi:tetratricopeptide (TPR) repeat protein